MSITEAQRHELHPRLEEVLGSDEASVLMEHLPPVGWADVATKQDLEHLRAATQQDIEHLGDRIENRLLRDQRTYMFAMLSAFVALMALTLAVQ
jgi:hypothetical protein